MARRRHDQLTLGDMEAWQAWRQLPRRAIITAPELAEYWDVCVQTLRREIERGNLPSFYVGGQLRFRRSAIRKYERQNTWAERQATWRGRFPRTSNEPVAPQAPAELPRREVLSDVVLAAYWQVSTSTLWREVMAGRLQAFLVGTKLRVKRTEVRRYEQENVYAQRNVDLFDSEEW